MQSIRIGIVAGEVSGDYLGAGLMRSLKTRLPNIHFEGIGGPNMQAEGCHSLHDMERLSIIGFEGLRKYPSILRIRRHLAAHFLSHSPDIFIGIDVPDFNLGLEQSLKSAGIPTVHYVSPTVWAWRGYRIHKIHKAVDHMLTLFPFEADYYRDHHVPVTFVGHPLADQIGEHVDPVALRKKLELPLDRKVIALLPGSRMNELVLHADLFTATAARLHHHNPDLHFVAPFVDNETRAVFEQALQRHDTKGLPLTLLNNHSREAMAAADIVLLASGTATLEAALLRKPMVVTYRLSLFSYFLIRMLSHVKLYSLPNHLAGRRLVPEYIQFDAVPEKLAEAIEHLLSHPEEMNSLRHTLGELHHTLRRNSNERAAEAVIKVLQQRKGGDFLSAENMGDVTNSKSHRAATDHS